MQLNKDQVRHVAKLARIQLTEEEVEHFSPQLSKIFQYMEILNEVDTDSVEPTSQVTGLQNVTRPDSVLSWVAPDALLACSQLPIEQHQIRVKPAITQ